MQQSTSPTAVSERVAEPSDAELVAAARAGPPRDRWGWEGLYRRYASIVHGVLLVRVNRSEADDLTQDVFVRAMRSVASLREDGAVGGWLMTIARAAAADQGRRRRRWWSMLRREELQRVSRHVAEERTSTERTWTGEEVLGAIRALPEAYQEPLVLRLVEGLTGPQIAELTGMTHGSVRVNLTRGMQMLREALAREGAR